MATYAFKAVHLRTGRVIADLPLSDLSAGLRLDFGRLDASMDLRSRPGGQPRTVEERRALLTATTSGITSIAVIRDGIVMGEWMNWSRRRGNGPEPVTLTGLEFGSWLSHVVVDGWTKRTDADQLAIAHDLAAMAVAKAPGMTATVEAAGTSGNLVEEADYPTGSEYIGVILSELADGINGFDWWVESEWNNGATVPTIKRTIRFGYPRRGTRLNARIDIPVRRSKSGVRFELVEDAERIATTVYMTGSGDGDKQLYSRGINADLFATYPAIEKIDSRSSYGNQALLDAQTQAVAAASRSLELPSTVQVRADGDLPLGSYGCGDSLDARMRPCTNFPDGYTGAVRVIGYTMRPPTGGNTEFVDVEIGRDDEGDFDT